MSKKGMNEIDLFRFELVFDGISGEDFAKSIGMGYASYKNVVRDGSNVVPKWVLSFLLGRGYIYKGNALVKRDSNTTSDVGSPTYTVKYLGSDSGNGSLIKNK
jgi:hypothetical protein